MSVYFDLQRQKIKQQLQQLSSNMHSLSLHIHNDQQIQPYLQQFQIDRSTIVNNFIRYSNQFQRIGELVEKRGDVNCGVFGELVSHIVIWLSQHRIYDSECEGIDRAISIFELDGKLICFEEFAESALFFKDDITSSQLLVNHNYDEIYKKIEVIDNQDSQNTKIQYEHMRSLIVITNSAVLTQRSQHNSLLAVMAFGLSYPRFLIDFKQAQLRNKAFLRQPSLSLLQSIWNLPQNGAISKLKYFQFQSIKTNQQLFISKQSLSSQHIFQQGPNTIKIRLLSNQKIYFWEQQSQRGCYCNCWDEEISLIDTIIIHAHGGGFVALSSSTMQNYTRRWANSLNVPVISIDYSKPPFHTFPDPVHDMVQVYMYITTQLKKICNIAPLHIILTGDSAGGNLICSLMGIILKNQLLMPKAMFLAYPACDLRRVYSPSRIHAFTDAILHPSLLLLCLRQYLGKGDSIKQFDPLATPLLLSQQYVGGKRGDTRFPLGWPKTFIIVGQNDPLLDDSLRLCERLHNSNIDFRCQIYRQMGHGFLSMQKMVSWGERGILNSIDILRSMLK